MTFLENSYTIERKRIKNSVLSSEPSLFCTPHIVVDDLFSSELLQSINVKWPSNGFIGEVKGNSLLSVNKSDYKNIEYSHFWRGINEEIWPYLMADLAEKFEFFGNQLFGKLYQSDISLDHPLTLMQADCDFLGHNMHTHFYHAPHWAFTVLIYVDPDDQLSEGTSLHALQPENGKQSEGLSCIKEELQRCSDIAFDTFRWLDPSKPHVKYADKNIRYKANRLIAFLDGPMSLHSVNDYSAIPGKIDALAKNPERSRRRILRSHVKIHHAPFYKQMSEICGSKIDPTMFMKCMAPNAELTRREEKFKEEYLRNFYSHAVQRHSQMADISEDFEVAPKLASSFMEKFKSIFSRQSDIDSNNYLKNFISKIP
jgi:hypothetical protein